MIALKALLVVLTLVITAFTVFKSIRFKKDNYGSLSPESVNIAQIGIAGLFLLFTLFVIIPSFGEVPSGHRGVVLNFGRVTGVILDEGLYFVTPFINTVELMDVQVHADASKATAASRDLQNIDAEVTINYRLDPNHAAETYRDLRRDYFSRIAAPAIQEAVKAVTARYDAEKLISERAAVRDAIDAYLKHRLGQHGMIVDGVSITDLDFSQAFNAAIESKQVAVQQGLKAKNDLERVKMEAEQRIAQARAEAEAIRIQAQAITSQGGDDYVALKAIEKWDGSLPQWMGGGSPTPFVNMALPK